MSLRSKLLGLFAFILTGALVFGYFLLIQTHTDFTLQDSVAEFDAHEFNQFIEKLNEAERGELGDNVYTVSGKVESKTGLGFILSGGIVCTTADSSDLGLDIGVELKVKGRFISYDELFQEVRLDHVVAM